MAIEYDPEAGIDYGIQYAPPAPMASPPMGPQFGSGPSIGSSGGYDPETGDRYTTQFRYTPVNPQDDLMRQLMQQSMQAFYPPPPQPRGPTPYWENPETYYPQQPHIDPIAQAKAATMAAQKFIAMRGYQNDMKEGMSAQDAMARWAPMLFQDTSVAPVLNAVKTPRQGQWIPPNAATQQPGFYQEPTQYGSRANYPTANSIPKEPIDFEKSIKEHGGVSYFLSPGGALTRLGEKSGDYDLLDYKAAQKVATTAQETLAKTASKQIRANALEQYHGATNQMAMLSAKKSQQALTPAPTAPITTPSYKEGEIVRNKTTKELFRIVNGVPVPYKEPAK